MASVYLYIIVFLFLLFSNFVITISDQKYVRSGYFHLLHVLSLLLQEPRSGTFSQNCMWNIIRVCYVYVSTTGTKKKTLRGIITLWRETVYCPFRKGTTLKGKNLFPLGNKFFPFRADPFPEGVSSTGKQKGSYRCCRSLVKHGGKLVDVFKPTYVCCLRMIYKRM